MPPLVTVGLPVRNGENFLVSALDSLLGQDFGDFELLLSDNGSDDGTEEICRKYAEHDSRVHYLRSAFNRGAHWNFNRLVAEANGRYFKWAAHDDVCLPSFLGRCVEVLQGAPDSVVLCYPRTVLINETGQVIDDDFFDGLDRREPSPHERIRHYASHTGENHAVFGLIRTDGLRRTQLLRNCWGGDIGLMAELLLLGQFWELEDRLFLRRYHPGISHSVGRTFSEVAAWFDPAKAGRNAFPRNRLLWEVMSTIARAPLSRDERSRCAVAVMTQWLPTHGRAMGGELKVAYRRSVRPRLQEITGRSGIRRTTGVPAASHPRRHQ
ncbi:MAG TPA: glycosyltransferase family 2 protein [Acidimicrobiales bacterium]|nr:glycosyltransferase family 2 protein [Acidimicrobiales bacterium]